MTRILESKGRHIPLLVDTIGNRLYIEMRVCDEYGDRCGSVHTYIDKEDARTLARNIRKWLSEVDQ